MAYTGRSNPWIRIPRSSMAFLLCLLSLSGCGVPMAETAIYSSSPIDGERITLVVQSDQGWQISGVDLHRGDAVFIEAQGQWTVDRSLWPMCGPNGYQGGSYMLPLACPDQAIGVLCARIGTSTGFRIGKQLYLPDVPAEGQLAFVCNEHPADWSNNAGSMTVNVVIRRANSQGRNQHSTRSVACDLRIIAMDGSGIASATGEATSDKLGAMAKGLVGKLKEGMFVKDEPIAVVTLRNRSGTRLGRIAADELADKVQGFLIDMDWFDVKERIDLSGIIDEKDLDTAGIVKKENVRKKLAGVKYIVIGGVTVTERGK